MKQLWTVARKDIREAFASKSTYAYLILLIVISFPFYQGASSVLRLVVRQGSSQEQVRLTAQAFLNTACFSLPLIYTMLISSILTAYAVVLDKTRRTLESLLATPLSLRQVWLGKALAVTLPSVIISLTVAAVAIGVIDRIVLVPMVGGMVWPSLSALFAGVIMVPVLTFLIASIVTFLQFTMANPRLANLVFTAIFMGIYIGTITQLTSKWDLSLIFLGFAAVLAIVTVFLSRFLTKERVVLSSKG